MLIIRLLIPATLFGVALAQATPPETHPTVGELAPDLYFRGLANRATFVVDISGAATACSRLVRK